MVLFHVVLAAAALVAQYQLVVMQRLTRTGVQGPAAVQVRGYRVENKRLAIGDEANGYLMDMLARIIVKNGNPISFVYFLTNSFNQTSSL